MGRPPGGYQQLRAGRVSEAGRIYFVTKVTRERIASGSPPATYLAAGRLVQPGVPAIIVDSLTWLHGETLIQSIAFCVMPDHLHWLFQLGPTAELSAVVRRFAAFTGRAIALQTRRGQLWFPGFHEHALRVESEIAAIASYIEQNPVRAGLVASAADWPWSSRASASGEHGDAG